MVDIFREQTLDEKKDFRDIGPTRKKDAKVIFQEQLGKKRLEISKKKLPFFKKAVMDDFEDHYKQQVKMSMRKNGYVNLDDIKPIKIDWDKYSSPENITLVEVEDIRDPHASKKHPFDVFVKSYRYKYKGYGVEGVSNISVMEEEMFAVKRARASYENKPELEDVSLAEKQSKLYKPKSEKKEFVTPDPDSPTGIKEEKKKKKK